MRQSRGILIGYVRGLRVEDVLGGSAGDDAESEVVDLAIALIEGIIALGGNDLGSHFVVKVCWRSQVNRESIYRRHSGLHS